MSSIPTGVSEKEPLVDIRVFPNPFEEEVVFEIGEWSGKEEAGLYICDLQGQVVRSYTVRRYASVRLQGAELTAGVYVYELRNEEGVVLAGGRLVRK